MSESFDVWHVDRMKRCRRDAIVDALVRVGTYWVMWGLLVVVLWER